MSGSGTLAMRARNKYWLDLYKMHRQASESSITALHYTQIFSWSV